MREANKLKTRTFLNSSAYVQWYNDNNGYYKIAVQNVLVGSGERIIVFYFSSKDI